jgi:hypothetical protein
VIYSNPNVFDILNNIGTNIELNKLSGHQINYLISNPNLFKIDYEQLKNKMYHGIGSSFYPKMYGVNNIPRFKYWGVDGFDDYEEDENEIKIHYNWWEPVQNKIIK